MWVLICLLVVILASAVVLAFKDTIAQLDEKYNIATRNNILANITYKYYLMSGNSETHETIAREMGYTEITIQSTSESFAKQNNMLGRVAL